MSDFDYSFLPSDPEKFCINDKSEWGLCLFEADTKNSRVVEQFRIGLDNDDISMGDWLVGVHPTDKKFYICKESCFNDLCKIWTSNYHVINAPFQFGGNGNDKSIPETLFDIDGYEFMFDCKEDSEKFSKASQYLDTIKLDDDIDCNLYFSVLINFKGVEEDKEILDEIIPKCLELLNYKNMIDAPMVTNFDNKAYFLNTHYSPNANIGIYNNFMNETEAIVIAAGKFNYGNGRKMFAERQIDLLNDKIDELNKKLNNEIKKNKSLKTTIEKQKKEIKELINKNNQLIREIDYKKKTVVEKPKTVYKKKS